MKRLSQSGSSNFCPELRKNALISQSHFSNFSLHVITKEISRAELKYMNIWAPSIIEFPTPLLKGGVLVILYLNLTLLNGRQLENKSFLIKLNGVLHGFTFFLLIQIC